MRGEPLLLTCVVEIDGQRMVVTAIADDRPHTRSGGDRLAVHVAFAPRETALLRFRSVLDANVVAESRPLAHSPLCSLGKNVGAGRAKSNRYS
jgi:hypothetical protein